MSRRNLVFGLILLSTLGCRTTSGELASDPDPNRNSAEFYYRAGPEKVCFQRCYYNSKLANLHPLKIAEQCDQAPRAISKIEFGVLVGAGVDGTVLQIVNEELGDVATTYRTTDIDIVNRSLSRAAGYFEQSNLNTNDCDLKAALLAGSPSVVQEYIKDTPPNIAGYYRVNEKQMGFYSAELKPASKWINREYRSSSAERALAMCAAYHGQPACQAKGQTLVEMQGFTPSASNLATDSTVEQNKSLIEDNSFKLSPPGEGLALTGVFDWIFKWFSGERKSKTAKKKDERIRSCFAMGTLVRTPNGLKPIEQLKYNDLVLTLGDKNVPTATRVVGTYRFADKQIGKLTLENGDSVNVTPEHPFLRFGTEEYPSVIAFGEGTQFAVISKKGQLSGLRGTYELKEKRSDVYNLILDGKKSFFVEAKSGLAVVSGVYDDGLLTTYNWRGYGLE